MNHNPYTAPQSNLDDDYDYFEYDTTPFYKPTGRIGRVRFLAYNGIWACILVVFFILLLGLVEAFGITSTIITMLGTPIMLYGVLTPMARRLTDLGRSRWWAVLYFVPFLNFVFFLYLIFAKGDEGVNDYGSPSLYGVVDIIFVCLVLSFIVMMSFFDISKSEFLIYLFGSAG
ncbi:DUF805 domain-containing protein [Moraxella oblonga]|uniref:DUF805 domain-containing protein n=1 Tax=Moraxella oblonga TaxID=200413 RepID=UPI00083610B1|nr:DUF805 domain-containing protein [Moraxella oblonga]